MVIISFLLSIVYDINFFESCHLAKKYNVNVREFLAKIYIAKGSNKLP